MSHNIQTVDPTGTSDNIQTTSRPIFIRFEHAADVGEPVAAAVQAEVSVEVDGIWKKVGGTLVANKEWDSNSLEPSFEFDISAMLASRIEDATFPIEDFSTSTSVSSSHSNTIAQTEWKRMIRYKVEVRALYVDSDTGILTLNESDNALAHPAPSDYRYAIGAFLPDSVVTSDKYSNLNVGEGWNLSAGHASEFQFLTNCPPSLRRRIFVAQPMALYGLNNDWSGPTVTVAANHSNDAGSPVVNDEVNASFLSSGVDDLKSINITPTDPYLFGTLSGSTVAACGKDFSLFMRTGAINGVSLNFELINSETTSNPNLSKIKPDDTVIYFINDFGVWDYYIFDGFLDITHTHEKSTFKRGVKDYTSRQSSRTGVSRGTTTETYTCRTLVNKEVSMWLSEIFRSRTVCYYDRLKSTFVPVTVVDGETHPSSSNKLSLEPFSMSFIKDTYTIKG